MKRRGLLKFGFLAALTRVISPLLLFGMPAIAQEKSVQDDSLFKPLIDGLRRTNKPVCMGVANGLARRRGIVISYDLHLRNASLNTDDAGVIATAINDVHKDTILRLNSFSVSYNPDIHHTGVKALLEAVPSHITELGLVGCNLDDQSGDSITTFLRRSKNLAMVCVEGNGFSPTVKSAIRNATKHLSGCVTII